MYLFQKISEGPLTLTGRIQKASCRSRSPTSRAGFGASASWLRNEGVDRFGLSLEDREGSTSLSADVFLQQSSHFGTQTRNQNLPSTSNMVSKWRPRHVEVLMGFSIGEPW